MLVFSLAGAPLSVTHDATRAVNLLYCCTPRTAPLRAWLNGNTMFYEMKRLFVSVSEAKPFSVFVHKCLMVSNDVEYTTFKMFVTQMSNYLFVISFQLMFYKTLRCSLAKPLCAH